MPSALPHAITWLLLVQLFFNCTQMHAITYTNCIYLCKAWTTVYVELWRVKYLVNSSKKAIDKHFNWRFWGKHSTYSLIWRYTHVLPSRKIKATTKYTTYTVVFKIEVLYLKRSKNQSLWQTRSSILKWRRQLIYKV